MIKRIPPPPGGKLTEYSFWHIIEVTSEKVWPEYGGMPRKHWQREEVDGPAEAKVCIPEEGHVKSLNDHRAIGVLAGFPPTHGKKRKSQVQNITPRREQLDQAGSSANP